MSIENQVSKERVTEFSVGASPECTHTHTHTLGICMLFHCVLYSFSFSYLQTLYTGMYYCKHYKMYTKVVMKKR